MRNAKNSFRRLSSLVRAAYRLEPMEPRLLLSADPLVGVVQALLLPNPDLDHALLAAYDADGLVHAPEKPGLGVELDMVEVEKAHQLYLQHGLGSRDDAMAMQYLIPGWTFNPKRAALDR